MGVPVHGRVRRRRNVCWFGTVHQKSDKIISTSSSNTSYMIQRRATVRSMDLSLVDVFLDEARAKCSKIGESHCYTTI